MAATRVILGAHSINQVLFGSLLGYWFAIVVLMELKPRFRALLVHIRTSDLYCFDGEYEVKTISTPKIMIFFVLFFALLFGSAIGVIAYD
jgi:hypothetical protein